VVSGTIVKSVRDYLLCLTQSGLPISFGVVFGSYAAGTANSDSDIDVMVVSPQFDKKIERQWINQLWRVAARTDSRIEPIPCGQQQWDKDTSSAIVEIARNEGQRIVL
jgi:predicted nucleotidyltransferase